MPWRGEGIPRDVEPAIAGEELVGEFMSAQEVDEALELLGVLGADVGSLAYKVLRAVDTADEGVHAGVAKATVDEDRTDHLAGGFQQHEAAIGHVHHVLHGGFVVGVFAHVQEFV